MWLIAFFGLCVFCFVAGTWAIKDYKIRRDAWILAIIGFIVGYGVEYWGVSTDRWGYHETDMFYISEIPIEILVGYAAGMFLLGLLVYYVSMHYENGNGVVALKFYPLVGSFFLVVSIMHYEVPIFVGASFLAFWGIMISGRPQIPIIVGITTFLADLVVEGALTSFTEYYNWNVGVAASFMLMGIFIAGVLTRKECRANGDFCFTMK